MISETNNALIRTNVVIEYCLREATGGYLYIGEDTFFRITVKEVMQYRKFVSYTLYDLLDYYRSKKQQKTAYWQQAALTNSAAA